MTDNVRYKMETIANTINVEIIRMIETNDLFEIDRMMLRAIRDIKTIRNMIITEFKKGELCNDAD